MNLVITFTIFTLVVLEIALHEEKIPNSNHVNTDSYNYQLVNAPFEYVAHN